MRVLKIIILHGTARWVLVAVKTIVVILVVIHPTEFLDHLASAVMIAIGCATVAAIPADHTTSDEGRAVSR